MNTKDQIRFWTMAARPKTLTASFIPVAAGTALVNPSQINWTISLYALCFAILIQVGTNLVNDALDFKKGTDTHERIGFKRVTQSGIFSAAQVLNAAYLCFAFALISAIPLMLIGGAAIILLAIASVIAGYGYTGGPYPLSYLGIADFFVFGFYGLIGTAGVYYLQTGAIDSTALLAGTQIGALATVIIAMNNLRDHKQDAKSDKKTIPVRFGVWAGRIEIATLLTVPFLLTPYWFQLDKLYAAILPWITVPMAIYLISVIFTTEPSRKYNDYFTTAALLHLSFGILLTIGLLL